MLQVHPLKEYNTPGQTKEPGRTSTTAFATATAPALAVAAVVAAAVVVVAVVQAVVQAVVVAAVVTAVVADGCSVFSVLPMNPTDPKAN